MPEVGAGRGGAVVPGAVAAFLREAAGHQPDPRLWSRLLVAVGLEPDKAAEIPVRLGTVFHLGAYDGAAVERQLRAWADGMRLRAEPDVAAQLDAVTASMREGLDPGTWAPAPAGMDADLPDVADHVPPQPDPPPPGPDHPQRAPRAPSSPPSGQRTGSRPSPGGSDRTRPRAPRRPPAAGPAGSTRARPDVPASTWLPGAPGAGAPGAGASGPPPQEVAQRRGRPSTTVVVAVIVTAALLLMCLVGIGASLLA